MSGGVIRIWVSESRSSFGNTTPRPSSLAFVVAGMGNLSPVAFDIETDGFDPGSVITVAGLAHQLSVVMVLNTRGRSADQDRLEGVLAEHCSASVTLDVCNCEGALLERLRAVSHDRLDEETHYLTAYHGETWNGGFDMPFLRTACVTNDVQWPFPDIAYADMLDVVDRFNTGDESGLVDVYDQLVSQETCDPFADSGEAVTAFRDGDWEALLLHNLADIQRTRELAALAGRYVPKSDFRMKNLSPPNL